MKFIKRVHYTVSNLEEGTEGSLLKLKEEWVGKLQKTSEGFELDETFRPSDISLEEVKRPVISIPEKFKKVDLLKLTNAESEIDQLISVLKSVHPWSSIKYGLTAVDTTIRLYTKTIAQWMGRNPEIQVLSPQVRGSMGTLNLNKALQEANNPASPNKKQIQIGEKLLREGDRVIQTRNNYNLGIFNGDIGKIVEIDLTEVNCTVLFSGGEDKRVTFNREDLSELQLAYGITIHKSQGSEFEVVIIPVLGLTLQYAF